MFKERIFRKTINIDNFRLVPKEALAAAGSSNKGKVLKKDAELIAQVYYTPQGFSCEIEHFNPIDTWSVEQFCRIEGIDEESPEGDLVEKYFDTKLAAMHFITRRLKRLGWDPLDNWHNA
jgi:hypothetical protein